MRLLKGRTFKPVAACFSYHNRQPIHLGGTIRPEGYPALVSRVVDGLHHSKKLGNAINGFGFVLQPSFLFYVALEAQRGQ